MTKILNVCTHFLCFAVRLSVCLSVRYTMEMAERLNGVFNTSATLGVHCVHKGIKAF